MENKINKVLSEIQKKLNAPKNQFNKFGNFSYRSCEDILEGIKPLLPEEYSVLLSDEIVELAGRFYIKATAALSNGEEQVETTAYAREPEGRKGMDEAQVTGATSSYARKYALNGLFAIDDSKDADTQNNTILHSASKNPVELNVGAQGTKLDAMVTEAQERVLRANNLYREGMTKQEAIEVIKEIKERASQ